MASRGFDTFDFSKSSEWLNYYQNIFPAPDYSRLLKIKQKWYKDHIDSTYDPNPIPQSSQSSAPRPQSSGARPQPQASTAASAMQQFQVLLFLLSIPGLFIGKALHLIIAGHLAGIIHYHNTPKLNLAYWRPVLTDDNMHAIAFALLCLVVPVSSLWLVPAYLGTLIYVAEVFLKHPRVPASLKAYARRIEDNKLGILQTRADCEVWVGFGILAMALLGYSHWISPVLYWQYTRMRYVLNYFSKITFGNLRVKGDAVFTGKPGVGMIWEKIKTFCNWLGSVDTNPSSSCEIF